MTHRRAPRQPARRALISGHVALGLLLFCLAPTAGNIGSCGQDAELLDAGKFFAQKVTLDCARCEECAIDSVQCRRACEGLGADQTFPDNCYPLVHDGEVCLDALVAASCEAYAGYEADTGATIPTECNFCPLDADGNPDPDGAP